MSFLLIGNHFKQFFVEFVSITWKLEGSLSLSNTLNPTQCIFYWKRVAFLFFLSVDSCFLAYSDLFTTGCRSVVKRIYHERENDVTPSNVMEMDTDVTKHIKMTSR